jgi:hypothetical protein
MVDMPWNVAARILILVVYPSKMLFIRAAVTHSKKWSSYGATRMSSACERFPGIYGYRRSHIKLTIRIPELHLPGKKIVLTSGPSNALEEADMPSPFEETSVTRGTVHMII